MRPGVDIFQMDAGLSYGLTEYAAMIDLLENHGHNRLQCRPHGGHLIIGMVGVPIPSGGPPFIGSALNIGDLGKTVDGVEKPVDVDVTERFCKPQLVRWRYVLIAQKNDAECTQRMSDLLKLSIAYCLGKIDAGNLSADGRRQACDGDVLVGGYFAIVLHSCHPAIR